jgi:hypothetical protein
MQRAFIQNLVENPSCTHKYAAVKAGCSVARAKQTAYEWMQSADIKRELDRQIAAKLGQVEVLAKSEKLTPERVIQDLDEIAEMCKTAGPGAWQASTLVKIAELKGKYLKMFTEKLEVGPTDALMELLLEGRRRAGLSAATPPLLTGGNDGPVQ